MEDFDLISNEGLGSLDGLDGLDSTGLGNSNNPFSSGFDSEHPMPSYEQLRNAGFCDEVAHSITDGILCHPYSQKELFHVLYESDDPVEAYNDMMKEKWDALNEKADALEIKIYRDLLGSSEANSLGNDSSYYNDSDSSSNGEDELGSCDCRSECKYNTGETYKYANYGYSD